MRSTQANDTVTAQCQAGVITRQAMLSVKFLNRFHSLITVLILSHLEDDVFHRNGSAYCF